MKEGFWRGDSGRGDLWKGVAQRGFHKGYILENEILDSLPTLVKPSQLI